jgi:flagellar biosynthesis/type III secretory pathway M-ring protein FliF/YscJ
MKKYKRQIIVVLVVIIAIFGFTFKTLVDRNNRNKELAKQMHSESIIKSR